MSFLPELSKQRIPGMGNPNANIMIVGDCPSEPAFKRNLPIVAPVEGVLESCLHDARLIKGEVYITNLIQDYRLQKYWQETKGQKKGYIKTDISEHRMDLHEEIQSVKPRIIITLGEMAAFALTGSGTLMGKVGTRGYPFIYQIGSDFKLPVIPSLHPRMMIWSNYIWRYYLSHDLQKAKKIAENPDTLFKPEVDTIIPQTFGEAQSLLLDASRYSKLSVDIEVSNYEVSCIGFAWSPSCAFSIPFDMRWNEIEEVQLWNLVARILGDEKITKVGQNFIFDMYFLALRMGIITRGPIIDAMTGHSILYPEFLKSLNFLGSLYTFQPQWKNMVSFKDIKQES